MTEERYAIYFVPGPQTSFYRFGAAVLSYDCYTDSELAMPDGLTIDKAEWRMVTREPRRYGFHATLKAPFRLARPHTEADLLAEALVFAQACTQIPIFQPAIELFGPFVAVVSSALNIELYRLAESCVRHFDRFRAPLEAAEIERRVAGGLTARETENLIRWGYPYVFDDFHFHMTLTGTLAPNRREPILSELQRCFASYHGNRPVFVDRIAVLRQDSPDAHFALLCEVPIGAPPK